MSKIFISVVLFVSLLLVGSLWYFSQGTTTQVASTDQTPSLQIPITNSTATTTSQTITSTPTSQSITDTNKKYMNAELMRHKNNIYIIDRIYKVATLNNKIIRGSL